MVLVACSVNGESSSTTQGTQIALQTTQISMQGTQVALAQIQATLPPTATPNLPSDIIFKKYSEIGGEIVLGKARGNAQPFPDTDGWFQAFANGTIYWSPRTQSHLILGAIQERWRSPVEGHRLGFPTSDEISTIDGHGKFQEFEHGDIYWSQQTGAHIVVGAILQEWMRLGKEASWLGYPISDEEEADGEWKRLTRFQNGVIKWSTEKGVVALPTAASTICPPVGATEGRIISYYESVTGHSQDPNPFGLWGRRSRCLATMGRAKNAPRRNGTCGRLGVAPGAYDGWSAYCYERVFYRWVGTNRGSDISIIWSDIPLWLSQAKIFGFGTCMLLYFSPRRPTLRAVDAAGAAPELGAIYVASGVPSSVPVYGGCQRRN